MSSRPFLAAVFAAVLAAPAGAASPPPTNTPQQAVDAVKRIMSRNDKACHLDWARIVSTGYKGHWTVEARIRKSDAGAGLARWKITTGWPNATNALARAIAHGCP